MRLDPRNTYIMNTTTRQLKTPDGSKMSKRRPFPTITPMPQWESCIHSSQITRKQKVSRRTQYPENVLLSLGSNDVPY